MFIDSSTHVGLNEPSHLLSRVDGGEDDLVAHHHVVAVGSQLQQTKHRVNCQLQSCVRQCIAFHYFAQTLFILQQFEFNNLTCASLVIVKFEVGRRFELLAIFVV